MPGARGPFAVRRLAKALTTTHELDDLKAVARLHECFLPLRARQDIEIALNSNAILSHAEVFEQANHREPAGDFAGLAVDDNRHFRVRNRSADCRLHSQPVLGASAW